MSETGLKIQDELDLVVMYPNIDDERDPVAKYEGKPVYLQFPESTGVDPEEDTYKGMPVRARIADVQSGVYRAIVTEVGDE